MEDDTLLGITCLTLVQTVNIWRYVKTKGQQVTYITQPLPSDSLTKSSTWSKFFTNLSLIYREKFPTLYIFYLSSLWKEQRGRVHEDTKIETLWVVFCFLLFYSIFFPFSIWAFASKHWLLRTRIFIENPHTWSPSSAFKLSTY